MDLSHGEVWDDSALIDSWNEALSEYKKYHSIHAKGGSLKDLENAQRPSLEHNAIPDESEITQETTATRQPSPEPEKPEHKIKEAVPLGPLPPALLASIRDENLKKLLMSWYYAGYYTGLYEGQQQTQQEPSSTS